MALKKEIYQALESVVGPEYISDDLGIINSYEPLRQLVEEPVGYIYEAVVLPKNTEEVPRKWLKSSRPATDWVVSTRPSAPASAPGARPLKMISLFRSTCDAWTK